MALDFIVTDQASVWLFQPLPVEANKFVKENVNFDEWFWQGSSFVVDSREAGALSEDLADVGFVIVTKH